MITIKREGTRVQLTFETNIPIEKRFFTFDWEAGKEYSAELLACHFNDVMEKKLEKIRKEAYDKGFDDHKKRIKRETWFSKWW